MIVYLFVFTHQTDEDTHELYDVSVSHGMMATSWDRPMITRRVLPNGISKQILIKKNLGSNM